MAELLTVPEIKNHKIVNSREWTTARKELLRKEKELTHLRDELSRQRRDLPWEKVEKKYAFEGRNGKETLPDLFQGRSQLIIYHFMFGPGWKEGCVGCSFLADHLDGAVQHLEHHDVSFVVVSRAPFDEIEAFHKRMGWKFKWQRFQLRLPRVVQEGVRQGLLQLRGAGFPDRGIIGDQRVLSRSHG